MGKPLARLKDVAEKTGFSINTVSLALRDSPRIPADTKVIIREAASELHYLPNYVAKSLVNQETKSIGLILTDLENPILTHVAQSIENQLARAGYSTLFATSNNNAEIEARMIETFRSRRADGMLIFPTNHRRLEHIKALRQRNYPIVLLVGAADSGVDGVSMDEQLGAHKAVSHLIGNGHKEVALIDPAPLLGNSEKQEGYLQAHADAGLTVNPRLFIDPKGHTAEAGYWAMSALMARECKPTAVFAANDSLALGVLRYCARAGIRVPEDVAIVGFDNIELAEFAVTPLTTVGYNASRVSQLAVERVIELISHPGELPPPRNTQVTPDLIVRESSARLRTIG